MLYKCQTPPDVQTALHAFLVILAAVPSLDPSAANNGTKLDQVLRPLGEWRYSRKKAAATLSFGIFLSNAVALAQLRYLYDFWWVGKWKCSGKSQSPYLLECLLCHLWSVTLTEDYNNGNHLGTILTTSFRWYFCCSFLPIHEVRVSTLEL